MRRCFLHVAKACDLNLGSDHPRFINELCRNLYDRGVLARQFISVHVKGLADKEQPICPLREVKLVHKTHLRLHADNVHGIHTDRKRKAWATHNTGLV